MKSKAVFLALLPLLMAALPWDLSQAEVKVPAIFGDHMVLQCGMPWRVWGWADAGEAVSVRIGEISAATQADETGKWQVQLPAMPASATAMELIIAGKNTLSFKDVLVGEVWLCSGQSNMAFMLTAAHNASVEVPKANHPTMRFFLVSPKIAFTPQQNLEGQWKVCTPETARKFSAVGYFFGREIQEALGGTPVGLIGSYWPGTPVQAWTSLEGLESTSPGKDWAQAFKNVRDRLPEMEANYEKEILPLWQKQNELFQKQIANKGPLPGQPPVRNPGRQPRRPSEDFQLPAVLFNGMIVPLAGWAIRGAIWYQGEGNVSRPLEYHDLFSAMIRDWRSRWSEGDFPFLFTQIANLRDVQPTPMDSLMAALREAQRQTLSEPNTGMAVTIDIGEPRDIHPKNKIEVGRRLAAAAKSVAYGKKGAGSGPLYDSVTIEGNQARIKFRNVGDGLVIGSPPPIRLNQPPAKPAAELKGFAIAGEDQKFHWAEARIEGDAVVVKSEEVKAPVAVRYGWADNPETNLYNKESLPASPFRTDDWPIPNPLATKGKGLVP